MADDRLHDRTSLAKIMLARCKNYKRKDVAASERRFHPQFVGVESARKRASLWHAGGWRLTNSDFGMGCALEEFVQDGTHD